MSRRLPLLLGFFAVSCGGDTELFELSFPSAESFVISDTARVYATPVDADGAGACRDLLQQVENVGPLTDAALDSGPVPVCEFLAQRVELPDVNEGPMAYVATARNTAGDTLLVGCTIRDVYADQSAVRIVLTPTDDYRELISAADYAPTGCSVEDRCAGTCP